MDIVSVGARNAALRVAEAHGLPTADVEVLSDRSSLLLHLKPAPVVVRIATTTALLRRPVGRWLARDLAVAEFLAGEGAPVVPPSRELPPGPHHDDGYVMSFWEWVEVDRDHTVTAAEAAPHLRELHAALARYRPLAPEAELPYLGVVLDEIPRWLKHLEIWRALGGMDLIALREAHWRLESTLKQRARHAQPLHGDAHRTNLLKTPAGLLWTDFEDTCLGPVAWDLACLLRSEPEVRAGGDAGEAALAAYQASSAGTAAFSTPLSAELLPYLAARALEAVVYAQVLAVRYPERAAGAREQLAEWRSRYADRTM